MATVMDLDTSLRVQKMALTVNTSHSQHNKESSPENTIRSNILRDEKPFGLLSLHLDWKNQINKYHIEMLHEKKDISVVPMP